MPRYDIVSLDDPRIAPFRNLKSTNQTRDHHWFICEGEKLVERLLASDFDVVSLLLDEPRYQKLAPHIRPSIPTFVVPSQMVSELVGFNFHRGALACGQRKAAPSWEALAAPLDRRLTLAVCPDVLDPVNLGSIARIALALGVDALIVGSAGADPFSRRVLRVSMGAILKLPVIEVACLAECLVHLRDTWHVELAATVLADDAELLEGAMRPERFALLLGNEGQGLSEELVALCRRRLTIPMQGGADSLNVAVAAGLFLYHFTRSCSFR